MQNIVKKLAWAVPPLALGIAAVVLLPGALGSAARTPDTSAEAAAKPQPAEPGVVDGQDWDAANVGNTKTKKK